MALLTHSPPAEVRGAHVPQQDEATSSTLLGQVQESLYGYWGTAKSAAQGLYEKTYLNGMDEKIRYQPTPTGNQEFWPPALSEPWILRSQPCPP